MHERRYGRYLIHNDGAHVLIPVSVVIPTYNSGRFLKAAIESVLNQDYKNLETIIIDDESEDGSREVVAHFNGVRYLRQKRSGPSAARNLGIKIAKGELIAFLDADDLWLPGKISKQVELINRNSRLGFVYCDGWVFSEEGFFKEFKFGERYRIYRGNIFYPLLMHNFIPSPSPLAWKRLLEKVGLFDNNLHGSEDWDLWLRVSRIAEADFLPETYFRYRMHSDNTHVKNVVMMENNSQRVIIKVFRYSYLPEEIRKKTLANHFLNYLWLHISYGKKWRSLGCLLRVIILSLFSCEIWVDVKKNMVLIIKSVTRRINRLFKKT